MRGVMRVVTVAGISLLLMAVLFGCAQPVREEMQGAGIRITIVAPQAARAINVSEYEVIALAVELYDPWDDLVATITWEPWEGLQSYVVPLSRTGQYRIEVTHTAEADGDIVEVMEWTYFTIQAMRITVIEVVPGAVLQINVGGEGEEPAPGELTVEEEIALMILKGMGEALVAWLLDEEYPAGLHLDDLDDVRHQGGGRYVVTFDDYGPPDSGITLTGEVECFQWHHDDDVVSIVSYGVIEFAGLSHGVCLMDYTLYVLLDFDLGGQYPVDWSSGWWDGTITVDEVEVDLGAVISEYLGWIAWHWAESGL